MICRPACSILTEPGMFLQVHLGERLGSGTFGTVYAGTCGGKRVAVKIPKSVAVEDTFFLSEVEALQLVTHPNIVGFRGEATALQHT